MSEWGGTDLTDAAGNRDRICHDGPQGMGSDYGACRGRSRGWCRD